MGNELTHRQQQVLDYIREYRDVRGYAPTVLEVGRWIGISRHSADKHLHALERKRLITREKGKGRTLAIV